VAQTDTTSATTAPDREQSAASGWINAVRGLRHERGGEGLIGYLFIGPAMVLFIIFNAYPLIRGVGMAFSDYRYLIPGHAPFNGIDNWREMFQDATFWASLQRSLVYMVLYIGVSFVLALLVAVLITEVKSQREAGIYRALVYLPVVLPIAIAVLIWKQLLSPEFGYMDYFLRNVLWFDQVPDMIQDPTWTIPVFALISTWKAAGTSILLLLVGLYSINAEVYEAASLDGAGWWRRLFTISIPLLRPTFAIIFVLGAGVLGMVEESLVFFGMTDAGPAAAGRVVGRYAYETAFLLGDMRWGYAAAMNLTVGLISIAISLVIFRVLRSERLT
jgi:ABC-type sugar transport system permease subunit